MATFKFGRTIDIHWNGYDIQGPADTVFSIPDQLYEEFDADISPVEPTLVWIDTNEFQTLQNSVSGSLTLVGSTPIDISVNSNTSTISINSGTALNGYLLAANGSGGVIFTPASTSGLTSVVGVSPISSTVSGGTVSVSLSANYQTAGTYVTSVIGTSPVSASGTTAITVSIDQTALSVADASTASTVRTYVKNSSGSTITKGQAVYVTSADGTNALIGLASASSDPASSKTLGIAANTMTNNAFGYVIENGQLSNIDTSAATAGSSVWLGATPGSLVFNSPPAEPNHFVYLGVVTKANVSTGEILVKVQNGYELNELHDVFTTGVSTSLPLVYNATSDGWIAQALSSVGIADNAIVTTKILDGAVTSAKLATDSVGAAAIAAGAVGTSELATGAVTSAAIATGAVTSGHIAAGAVGTAALATAAVTDAKIAANAVTSGHILAGAVGSAALATGAVTDAKIAANAVTSGHIAAGAVGTAALATGAVVAAKIATGAVTSGHIAASAVGSAALADNAVVAAKINAAAVGTAKIDSTGGSNGWVLTANGSGGATFAAAASGGGIISVTSITANTTIALTDKDDLLYVNSASNLTITIPPNSTAAFSVADQVHLLRAGTGTVTVAAGTGVTIQRTYGLTLRAQWSSATLIKTDTNTWILVGDIA